MITNEDIKMDTFFDGRLTVFQSVQGYRFSIDAVLLAALPQPKPGEVVLDIGTGCGILPLILAFRHPQVRCMGVELQAELADIALHNVAANHMQDRIAIINQDIRSISGDKLAGPVDWIVCNPPYRPANSGRINPNGMRAQARHEINLTLTELMRAARKYLRTGGRIATIYPIGRLVDLLYEMRMAGIEPKWMQSIHSHANEAAKLVRVQGLMRGNPGLEVVAPLVIYGPDGAYTRAVNQMMAP